MVSCSGAAYSSRLWLAAYLIQVSSCFCSLRDNESDTPKGWVTMPNPAPRGMGDTVDEVGDYYYRFLARNRDLNAHLEQFKKRLNGGPKAAQAGIARKPEGDEERRRRILKS